MNEEIQGLKEKILHPKAQFFHMARVPNETIDVFKKHANDHFCGDYGLCFAALVNKVLVEPQMYDHIYQIMQDHENRLSQLENNDTKPKIIKTINGRELRRKE